MMRDPSGRARGAHAAFHSSFGDDGTHDPAHVEIAPRGPAVTDAGPLAGRAALITGASQGLGRAIAAAYLRAGASIAIRARDQAALEQATVELAALAGPAQQIVALACDV